MARHNPVIVFAGAMSAVATLAAAAMSAYVTYKHFAIPVHHGRGSDVWGAMMVFAYVAFFLFGIVTLAFADDADRPINNGSQPSEPDQN